MEWWFFRSRAHKVEEKTGNVYSQEPEPFRPSDRLFNLQQTFGNQAVQRMVTNRANGKDGSREIYAAREGGEALPQEMRETMEARFGEDFSDVRVHADERAGASATALDANAYTIGRDIYFARGMYTPQQQEGQRLIAHELAHVVQQGRASEAPPDHQEIRPAPQHAEQAAEAASMAVARGESAPAQPGQSLQLAMQTKTPAPAPASTPISPPAPVFQEKKPPVEIPPIEERDKKPPKPRAPVGKYGMFPDNSPTQALRRWNYVVYENEVRLGNRLVDDSGSGIVIGSLPWMTNNPGDLTGDIAPREVKPKDPKGKVTYWQNEHIWGRPIRQGATRETLEALPGDEGLSPENTAIEGAVARRDLAIFETLARGRAALKEWIQKYYKDLTLAGAVTQHLGNNLVPGIDDPKRYAVMLQQYLSDKKYPANYVESTLCKDIKEEEWNDVIDAFAYTEGVYIRRPVPGKKGQFKYHENRGVIYRCDEREEINVDPTYKDLGRVKNLPQKTPKEIKELLGCD